MTTCLLRQGFELPLGMPATTGILIALFPWHLSIYVFPQTPSAPYFSVDRRIEDPNNVYNSTKSTDEKHSFEDSVKPSWFTSAANVPCHLHQEQPQGFPNLLQVPKLCLDTRVLSAQIPSDLTLAKAVSPSSLVT